MNNILNSEQNLLYIDGLRAIASIYFVMHHESFNFPLTNLNRIQEVFVSSLGLGHFAVELFIVIYGFALILPAMKREYTLYRHST